MTEQNYEDFAKKLQDDAAMRQELQARFGSADQGIAPKDLAEFAAGKGYQFEVDEVPGELSESQLEGVSGGGTDMFLKIGDIKGETQAKIKMDYKFGSAAASKFGPESRSKH